MREEEKYIKSYDGELIYAKEYTVENPKGTIVLTTDIKEHSMLYTNFALKLQEANYNVFTYDLRAHKNSAKEPFGTYSNNFFNDCVRDLLYLNKYLSKKYETKIINIGLGLGGIVILRMLQFNNEDCINILVGTPFSQLNISNYFYRCVTRLALVFVNKHSEVKGLNKIIDYFKKHKFEDGAFESTNKEYIEKIRNDKFCNFNISANMLNSIYKGQIETFSSKNLNKINNTQKFLLCCGEYDVITKFGKSTEKLAIKLAKCGKNCNKIIFKDLRHNLINESNNTFIEYLKNYLGENENDSRRN
ncbi:MAG: alpha/beta hydrolase [Clostridiales bacterium]|nr:alpha/beta hydrolase [Clostridiales bacterium]